MSKQFINIPGTLKSVASDGIVAYSDSIYDETQNKALNTLNSDFRSSLNLHASKLDNTYTKDLVNNLVGNLISPPILYVNFESISQAEENISLYSENYNHTIFRIGNFNANTGDEDENCYSECAYDGERFIPLAVKSLYEIDDTPTGGSNNFVRSGGVENKIAEMYINSSASLVTDYELRDKAISGISSGLISSISFNNNGKHGVISLDPKYIYILENDSLSLDNIYYAFSLSGDIDLLSPSDLHLLKHGDKAIIDSSHRDFLIFNAPYTGTSYSSRLYKYEIDALLTKLDLLPTIPPTLIWHDLAKDLDLSDTNNFDFGVARSGGVQQDINPVIKTVEDGHIYLEYTGSLSAAHLYPAIKIQLPEDFTPGNKYFLAIDIELIEDTHAVNGDVIYTNISARSDYRIPSIVSSNDVISLNSTATEHERVDLKYIIEMLSESVNYPARQIRLQFGDFISQLNSTRVFKAKIYNVCFVNMTALNISNDEIDNYFSEYNYNHADGYTPLVYDILVKKSVQTNTEQDIKPQIDIWGDSLVALDFGAYINLNRIITPHGSGGKKSTYIRDKFIHEVTGDIKNHSFIFLLGRNNYRETDVIILDIKAMVLHIGHQRFIICMPPNGNYGEGSSNNNYEYFTALSERLQRLYPNNFVDTRRACIEEYNMDVKLTSSFIQPNIGENITILVSDASFLTTYNNFDFDQWHDDFMEQIVIGQEISAVDIYKVISKDLEQNELTIQLVTNGSGVLPGDKVGNGADNGGKPYTGGSSAIKYLRVLQYADYYCYINDITQSTFRQDGIHMSNSGLQTLAKVVERAIVTKNI